MLRKTSKKIHDKLLKNKPTTHVKIESKKIEINNIPELSSVSEFIKDKLYFVTLHSGLHEPRPIVGVYFFTIDNELIYDNFYNDFGPLNLSCLYKYCWSMNKKLSSSKYKDKKIVQYTLDDDEEKRVNAAYLIAAYGILYLGKSPHESYKTLVKGNSRSFKQFQDASMGNSIYRIRLQDCLNGLYRAVTFGLFNFDDFDLEEYEKYEKLKFGDLNWIVPDKFIAFIGPSTESGRPYHQPEAYINYFLKNNVAAIVRLNRPCYDSKRFTKFGIAHYEMFLPDGSTPSKKILNQFLKLAEKISGPIAVHCKAGLGRTGSLIAAYLIKHYKMTAKEAIAWIRICRPGSVIGHQQSWLEKIQNELWIDGQYYRQQNYGNSEYFPHHKRGVYSLARMHDKKINELPSGSDYSSTKNCKRNLDKGEKLEKDDYEDENNNYFEKQNTHGLFDIFCKIRPKVKASVEESRDLTQGDLLNRVKIMKLK